MSHMSTGAPALPFTGDHEADALVSSEPLALLLGFLLDQQVTVQKAFSGPLELRRRIGSLDAQVISGMDPDAIQAVFRERPALHRFPAAMASRTQELCTVIANAYANDAGRVWADASDAQDCYRRLLALPGIGEMKARTIVAVLARRLGVRPSGWEAVVPSHPTLADVDSAEALARYQAGKRAHKAELRAKEKAG